MCTTASASPYQIAIHDEAFSRDSRTLASRIYYPTEAEGPRQNVGANPVFTGIAGQIDAPPAKGTFPLVVFSHGSGGNNTSQAWLAAALVSQGVVVIAANSPGSTTGDSVPAQSINLWRQTEDISALIDAIGASPRWAALVNPHAIGVVGHPRAVTAPSRPSAAESDWQISSPVVGNGRSHPIAGSIPRPGLT